MQRADTSRAPAQRGNAPSTNPGDQGFDTSTWVVAEQTSVCYIKPLQGIYSGLKEY